MRDLRRFLERLIRFDSFDDDSFDSIHSFKNETLLWHTLIIWTDRDQEANESIRPEWIAPVKSQNSSTR